MVRYTHANRMLAAYGSVDNYQRWLVEQIINYVTDKEEQEAVQAFVEQSRQQKMAARAALMPQGFK